MGHVNSASISETNKPTSLPAIYHIMYTVYVVGSSILTVKVRKHACVSHPNPASFRRSDFKIVKWGVDGGSDSD
jgi:hypothetical protein